MNHEELDGVACNLFHHFMKETAKHTPKAGRSKQAIFPVRTGDLSDLVGVFTAAGLADSDVMSAAMVDMWWCKAWAYAAACALNRLAGCNVRPKPRRWSVAERRMMTSALRAVDRRCPTLEAPDPLTNTSWQKEMSSRRVGYAGEEVETCHELTWDQIQSALPPESHGGCIDALKWIGPRTREYLLNPEWLFSNLRPKWSFRGCQDGFISKERTK